MRSEERLRESYNKQKEAFELAQVKKLNNLKLRQEQVEDKLKRLQNELNRVQEQVQEEKLKEFPSFQTFQERAIEQSQQSRQKTVS